MKNIRKTLIIIGAVACVAALLLFTLSDRKVQPGFFGAFNAVMDVAISSMLLFLVLAGNFFALRFVARRLFQSNKKK